MHLVRSWHLADITNRGEPCLLSQVKRTSADLSEMSGYDLKRTFCAIGGGLVTNDGTAVAFDPNVKRLGKFASSSAILVPVKALDAMHSNTG